MQDQNPDWLISFAENSPHWTTASVLEFHRDSKRLGSQSNTMRVFQGDRTRLEFTQST